VAAKVRKRLSARKEAAQKTDVDRFNLKKLSETEVRREFQIELSKRFAALENSNDSEDINRAWENVKGNIKFSTKATLGPYGRKQHKPWFDGECSQVLGERKQAKMHLLQDPSQSNLDNMNIARHEASRYFKKTESQN
jgi:hypothetical protein